MYMYKKASFLALLVSILLVSILLFYPAVFPTRAAAAEKVLLFEDFDAPDAGVNNGLPADWQSRGGIVYVSAEEAYSGSHSLKVDDVSSTKGAGCYSKPVPVRPGVEYVATAWVKTISGAVQLHLQFYNAEGVQVGTSYDGRNRALMWTMLRTSGVAPADAVIAKIIIWGHVRNIGIAYYDDVQIIEISEDDESLPSSPPATLVQPANQYAGLTTAVAGKTFTYQVSGHPRLDFTAQDIDAIHARLSALYGDNYTTVLSNAVGSANDILHATTFSADGMSFPLPPVMPVGDHLPWQTLTLAIRNRLQTLSQAYAITGNEKYAVVAKRDLLAMTEWPAWDGRTDHSVEYGTEAFNTTYLVEGMAKAYDQLYSYFTPEERVRVRQAILDKGLRPLYNYVANNIIDHNKYIIRAAALGYGALALHGEEPDTDKYISLAYERCLWYLDERAKSGKTEGMNYLSVSMGHMMLFAEALERITGDRALFDHPYVKEVLSRFTAYFAGPSKSGLVNFGDAELSNYLLGALTPIARLNNDVFAKWYVYAVNGTLGTLFYPNTERPEIPAGTPTSVVFADIGWAALRSGWNDNDTLLAFISSQSNMGHNHMDANHFVLNVGGKWLIKDQGYRYRSAGPQYDFSFGSLGHNTATVNDATQTVVAGGKIIAAFLSPVLDYVAGDATRAYSSTPLQGWLRHIYYVKPDYFIFHDEMLLQKATDQPALQIHHNGAVYVDGALITAGYSGQVAGFTICDGSAQASLTAVWPHGLHMNYNTAKGAESYGAFVSLLSEANSRRHNIVTLLDPQYGAEQAVMITDVTANNDHISFSVKVGDRTDYVRLGLRGGAETMPAAAPPVKAAAANAGGVSSDGTFALVSVVGNDIAGEYSLLAGKHLVFAGKAFIQSDVEVSVAVSQTPDGEWVADINAAANGTVQFLLPDADETVSLTVQAGMQQVKLGGK